MTEIEIITAKIADVNPFREYKACPVCQNKNDLIHESSGSLIDWTHCTGCESWFCPEVTFIGDDEEERRTF